MKTIIRILLTLKEAIDATRQRLTGRKKALPFIKEKEPQLSPINRASAPNEKGRDGSSRRAHEFIPRKQRGIDI